MESGVNLGAELPEVGLSLLRLVGALALVLAVFFGGVWLYRNWQRVITGRTQRPRLRVLETRPLGPRQALYVVAYDQHRFLVGASPAGLSLLTHLPDAEPQAETPPTVRAHFDQTLQQAVGQSP